MVTLDDLLLDEAAPLEELAAVGRGADRLWRPNCADQVRCLEATRRPS